MIGFLIAGLCAGLVFYPYLIYPLILSLLPKKGWPASDPSRAARPSSALVFCAHNEERSLPEKLKNLKAIKQLIPEIEILAYSDCSTDQTATLLAEAAESGLLRFIDGKDHAGKATGMKRMVATLNTDVIIFTDANVSLEPESAVRLLQYFNDPDIGCVAGTLHYVNPGDSTTSKVGSLYWRIEEWIKRLESDTGSTLGADGAVFAARRDIYPDVPYNLLDDMTVSMTPLFYGRRVISAPDVMAYEKATTASSDEFRRKRRIACRAFKTHLFLYPKISKLPGMMLFKYWSHKVIRWFGVIPLVICALAFFWGVSDMVGPFAALGTVTIILVALITAAKASVPILSPIVEILKSIVATGIGVAEAIMGKDYTTWKPAESRG